MLINVYRIFPVLDIMNLFMFVCDSSVVSSVLTVQILQLTLYDLLISESYSLISFWILNTWVLPLMSMFDFIIVLNPGGKQMLEAYSVLLDGIFLCVYSSFYSWTSQNLMEVRC